MSGHVFISHSSADSLIAAAVCQALERGGVTCWMAPRNIPPGAAYGESIVNAISGSEAVVLIFSSNSNRSQHVMRELERAVAKDIPIIPFRIEEVQPSTSIEYFVSAGQWLDAYVPPLDRHLDGLVSALRTHPGVARRFETRSPSVPEATQLPTHGGTVGSQASRTLFDAPAGSTLELPTGVISIPETISIERSLTIVGRGMNKTILSIGSGNDGVKLVGNGPWTVKDLTISRKSPDIGNVLSCDGYVEIVNCAFHGGKKSDTPTDEELFGPPGPVREFSRGAGVCFEHRSSGGSISGSSMSENDIGVNVSSRGDVSIESCKIFSNAGHGIAASQKGTLKMSGNLVAGNGGSGVTAQGALIATRNEIKHNGTYGINIMGGHATLADNICESNRWYGIRLGRDARAKLSGNRVSGNIRDQLRDERAVWNRI